MLRKQQTTQLSIVDHCGGELDAHEASSMIDNETLVQGLNKVSNDTFTARAQSTVASFQSEKLAISWLCKKGLDCSGKSLSSLVDWQRAPEWANYIARNGSGIWRWYEEKPLSVKNHEFWWNSSMNKLDRDAVEIKDDVPWNHSCFKRESVELSVADVAYQLR